MRRLHIACLGLALLSSVATAQREADDRSRQLVALRDQIRTYTDGLQQRRGELDRNVWLLDELGKLGDSITGVTPGMTLTHAQRKLQEIDDKVREEPSFPQPASNVLANLGDILRNPGFTTPSAKLREQVFAACQPLEERLISQATVSQGEAGTLLSIGRNFQSLADTIRGDEAKAIHALIQQRKLALGMPVR